MKRSKPEQDHTTPHLEDYLKAVAFQPIGRVRSPYRERFGTPRQPGVTEQVKGDDALPGTIEILPKYAECLDGLADFSHIWVVYAFHLNDGFRPTIRPPRGPEEVGILASRSPHRPNPIGLSCLRLTKIDGCTLHVKGLDILDGSPVLDVKPYIAYADSFPNASKGWLEGLKQDGPDRFESSGRASD